jgi:alpha-tubulin suppressor-like RCC1 family protein
VALILGAVLLGACRPEVEDETKELTFVPLNTALGMATGENHTCAILDDSRVKCWGVNIHGELGLGDIFNRGDNKREMGDSLSAVSLGTGRTALAIDTGADHVCARLDDSSVKCWGDNSDGQLGLGDTFNRGDGAGEMGDSLSAISLGTGRTATAIAAGYDHSCAILDDGLVKCWGINSSGQLGLGNTSHRGDEAGEMGDSLPVVDLGRD